MKSYPLKAFVALKLARSIHFIPVMFYNVNEYFFVLNKCRLEVMMPITVICLSLFYSTTCSTNTCPKKL